MAPKITRGCLMGLPVVVSRSCISKVAEHQGGFPQCGPEPVRIGGLGAAPVQLRETLRPHLLGDRPCVLIVAPQLGERGEVDTRPVAAGLLVGLFIEYTRLLPALPFGCQIRRQDRQIFLRARQ
jgi:hypothetical protein